MEKQNMKGRPSEVAAILGKTKDSNISSNGKDTQKWITPGNQKTN
jgi:hypothetical protein